MPEHFYFAHKQEKPASHHARPASRSLLRRSNLLIHHQTGLSRAIKNEKDLIATPNSNKKRGVTSVFANHSDSLARSVGANSHYVVATSLAARGASASHSHMRVCLPKPQDRVEGSALLCVITPPEYTRHW